MNYNPEFSSILRKCELKRWSENTIDYPKNLYLSMLLLSS